jgi:hypothetical protein
MRAAIFTFVSLYVKYNFCYAAVRFESQLLNGEECKDRQRFMRCSDREEKRITFAVARNGSWRAAPGCVGRSDAAPLQRHFTSLRQPQAWPLYREVAAVIRRCHNSNSN